MKRDLDLCTTILLAIEELPPAQGWHELEFEGIDEVNLSYQIKTLNDMGLLDAKDLSTKSGFCWKAKDLTGRGHDFLDEARTPVWFNKFKKKALETGLDLIFLAIKYKLAQSLGIKML